MPSWRRCKSAHMKSHNSIMHENYEEFVSLTQRMRNSKRSSRMLARNWTHQWLPLWLARWVTRGKSNEIKSKLACILEASESTRLRMGEYWQNHQEDHIAAKGGQFTAALQFGTQMYSYAPSREILCSKGSSGQGMGKLGKDSSV